METFTDEIMRRLLASSLETSTVDESGWRDHGAGPGSGDDRFPTITGSQRPDLRALMGYVSFTAESGRHDRTAGTATVDSRHCH